MFGYASGGHKEDNIFFGTLNDNEPVNAKGVINFRNVAFNY